MNEKTQEFKEIIEVAIHISSGIDLTNIIQGVVWFLSSKFSPKFMTFIFPTDMDDMKPNVHFFEGIERKRKTLKFESVIPLIDYFNKVEYTQLSFKNFKKSFPYKKIAKEIDCLNPDFLMPLKSDKVVVGIFVLGSKSNGKNYETEEIQVIDYINRFASIAIENSNLYKRAIVDRMSKLYTHHHFQKKLEEEITRCQRYKNYFSVIILDIDHFKKFNDTYGHLQGDTIVKIIAKIINKSIRNIDFPARYGGEEFAIILPQINAKEAVAVAERLRQIVEKYDFPGKNNTLHVTISLGVAQFKKKYVQKNKHIIHCADEALYKSKRKGRNRVSLGAYKKK